MIYLKKNDVWDEVWARYLDSYTPTKDCGDYVPKKDIDNYHSFLRRRMRDDLKQAKKEAKKIVKRLCREERRKRRKEWWAHVKAKFSRKGKDKSAQPLLDPNETKPENKGSE